MYVHTFFATAFCFYSIQFNSIQFNSIQSFFYIAGYRDATPLPGHIKSDKYKILQKSL